MDPLDRAVADRRRQAAWAARSCDALVPVSRHVRATIVEALDGAVRPTDPIPLTVDDQIFRPRPGAARNPDQLLFVGAICHVKGVDVLLEALVRLRRHRPAIRLVIAGEPFYRSYHVESERMAAPPASSESPTSCMWSGGSRRTRPRT